jgi:glyoxylase-like metal-dependent hydrolase (beta-lactamase superfamily II)
VLDRTADYAEHYAAEVEADRRFARALMTHHGVPDTVIAAGEEFWDYIRATTEDFRADARLADGDRIRAGGRSLRVVARPGHSTTDTLFVDDEHGIAFVGDHVLARISSNTEIYPGPGENEARPRARHSYLDSLRKTAEMPLERLLTGHGSVVTGHAELIRARLDEHEGRSQRIADVLAKGPSTAYGVAAKLWPAQMIREQPLLVLWEVLGHIDLMLCAGVLDERRADDGRSWFTRNVMAA